MLIISVILEKQPKLLDDPNFKCSPFYVGQFLESVMKWSIRKGTRAAAHLPADADVLCERTFFRLVHLINFYDIPSSLIINMDQTGVILPATKETTYDLKGKKQISISHRDEKRAFTLCVASTPAGDILPFQHVWAGQSKTSLPSPTAERYDEAIKLGMDFAFAKSPKKTSHFSTEKTMEEWMEKVALKWIQFVIERDGLRDDQKAIILLDCYPVHISEAFRVYVFKEYPNIFLVFIPGGCTGAFQPADVGLQRIVKHFLRQKMLDFLIENHRTQMRSGIDPAAVKMSTSLPFLRNATVAPTVELFNFLDGWKGREIVRSAWSRCVVKDYNLGDACLQSKESKAAYRDYVKTDTTLRREIEAKLGEDFLSQCPGLTPDVVPDPEDPEDDSREEEMEEVPIDIIIEQDTGITGPFNFETPPSRFSVARENLDKDLVPTSATENVWAVDDELETLEAPTEDSDVGGDLNSTDI